MEVDKWNDKNSPAPPKGCSYVDAKSARMRYNNNLDVDVSLKEVTEQYVVPINGINPDGPFEFAFDPIRDTAMAMDRMIMYMRAEVVDAKSGVTYSNASNICSVNFLLNTMWKSVECRVNGEALNLTASQNTAYKSLIQAYATVDANAAGNLMPSLYTPESSSTSSSSMYPELNTSTKRRREMLNLGKGEFELCGPVTGVDFLTSDAYLAPFNSLNLKFSRHEDAFIFNTPGTQSEAQLDERISHAMPKEWARLAAIKVLKEEIDAKNAADALAVPPIAIPADRTALDTKLAKEKAKLTTAVDAKKTEFRAEPELTPTLKIKEIGIYTRRIELTNSALKSYFQTNSVQRYLGNLTDVHSIALTPGIDRRVIRLTVNNVIPKQIIVGMTLTTAAKGKYNQNPFNFEHFGLNRIALKVNAIRVPQEPLEPNFDKGHYMREYVHTLANCGKWRSEVSNSITPLNFASGVTLFAFDLTPDACAGYHVHAGKEGAVELELGWVKELEKQITVYVFSVKDQIVTIDPTTGGAPEASAF